MPNFADVDMKDASTASSRVYVGGITEEINSEDLYEVFKEFGNILGIRANRGYGFVQFESEESASLAIQRKFVKCNQKSLVVKEVVTQNKNITENVNTIEDKEDDSIGRDEQNLGDDGINDNGRKRPLRGPRNPGGGNFRDRSPIHRGHYDSWEMETYDRYSHQPSSYRLPEANLERNDCEIIVVSRVLTEYAEFIEDRLKRMGLVVDLLFPNENVPIGRVLGNIASRGCLYAILIMPQNYEHHSLTLNILHGLPQEHRNMPMEDAFELIAHNWREYQTTGRAAGRPALIALLKQLAAGHILTVLQYDTILHYIKECREKRVKTEFGESAIDNTTKTAVDLQQRIMSILESNNKDAPNAAGVSSAGPATVTPPVINNPSVQKALDALLSKII